MPTLLVLSEEQNKLLTQVGPGTPMGDLLRRYWMPIAAVSELEKDPIKPVRLMGEDLVLYRDFAGDVRLGRPPLPAPPRRSLVRLRRSVRDPLQLSRLAFRRRRALHRAAVRGRAHPEARFRDKVRITSYPVEAKAGLVWAYLGPQPRRSFPNWETFT